MIDTKEDKDCNHAPLFCRCVMVSMSQEIIKHRELIDYLKSIAADYKMHDVGIPGDELIADINARLEG